MEKISHGGGGGGGGGRHSALQITLTDSTTREAVGRSVGWSVGRSVVPADDGTAVRTQSIRPSAVHRAVQCERRVIIKEGRRKPLQDQGERENAAPGERASEQGSQPIAGDDGGGRDDKKRTSEGARFRDLQRARTAAAWREGGREGGMKDEKKERSLNVRTRRGVERAITDIVLLMRRANVVLIMRV